jgi:hypothetical protein
MQRAAMPLEQGAGNWQTQPSPFAYGVVLYDLSERRQRHGSAHLGNAYPRTGNAGLHDFYEMLMIALCAVLCSGQGARHMAAFAVAKEPFLRGFLTLENGLPSHDTFSRLFRLLDPEQFRAAFQRFMARFSETDQDVVAIDGTALRRSFDRASGQSALHMVSAWGCEQRLVLGQIATEAKSNEITAVPKLLEMLSLAGAIVTTDALNCQRPIAQQIVDQALQCERTTWLRRCPDSVVLSR